MTVPRTQLPSRWPAILVSVLFGLALAVGLAILLFAFCPTGLYPAECPSVRWNFMWHFCGTVKTNPPWVFISGIAAAPSLLLTWWWRTKHKDEDNALAHRQERSTRFFEAVKLLAGDKLEARLGAIYSLEALVNDAYKSYRSEEYGRVTETLCAFVRQNGTPIEEAGEEPIQSIDILAAFTVLTRLQGGVEMRNTLTGIDLRAAELWSVEAPGASLQGFDLSGANLCNANFSKADLRDAVLKNANLADVILEKADLRDADFSGARIVRAHAEMANMERTCFAGASFRHAHLEVASFENADLERADFEGAMLAGVNFRQANLRGALFKGAQLAGANLREANLGASIFDAPSQPMDRQETRLQGVNLSMTDLDGAFLSGAVYDAETTFPEGFDPDRAGMSKTVGEETQV